MLKVPVQGQIPPYNWYFSTFVTTLDFDRRMDVTRVLIMCV